MAKYHYFYKITNLINNHFIQGVFINISQASTYEVIMSDTPYKWINYTLYTLACKEIKNQRLF